MLIARFVHLLLVAPLVVLATFSGPSSAEALTISPVRLEIVATPGEVIDGDYRVTNDTPSERTYYSVTENFRAQGETGVPQFVREQTGLANWVSGPATITLAPNESRTVPFSITVPADAQAGGYFAAQFWASQPQVATGGNTVGYRVGVLLLVRVSGEITEAGGLLDYEVDKTFTATTPLSFSYRFNNDGDDRLLPEGDVVVTNMFGKEVARLDANPTVGNVLPLSARKYDLLWDEGFTPEDTTFWDAVTHQFSHFHLGFYTATLGLSFGAQSEMTDYDTVRVFFLPTQLLLVVLGVVLFLFMLLRIMRWQIRRGINKEIQINSVKK